MNFDRVAIFYKYLEYLSFGKLLEKARFSQLDKLEQHLGAEAKVLIVGDGDGRFLEQFLLRFPLAQITFLEHSEKMTQLAKLRTQSHKTSIDWVIGDVREWNPGNYDLISTHFVLDCFDEDEKADLIKLLSSKLAPSGFWLISDFDRNVAWWSRLLVSLMYLFFSFTAGLKKCVLNRPDSLLIENQLGLLSESLFIKGFVYSYLWFLDGDLTRESK